MFEHETTPNGAMDRLKISIGWVCLLASLLLISSGVQVSRAAEPQPAPVAAAGAETPKSTRAEEIVMIPEKANGEGKLIPRSVDPQSVGSNDVIHLNTRGYNYQQTRPEAVAESPASADPDAAPASPDPSK